MARSHSYYKMIIWLIVVIIIKTSLSAQTLYWQAAPPYLGDGRTFQHVFTLNNIAYVGGGATTTNTILSKQLWKFSHTTNAWTRLSDPPFRPRLGAFAFSLGGYGYVGSGSSGGNSYFIDFWRYDPALDTWQQMQDLPKLMRGRIEPAVMIVNNRAYVVGGVNSGGNPSDVWEYSPGAGGTQGTWTELASSGPNPFAISGYVEGFGEDPTSGNQGYLYVGVSGINSSCSNGFWRFDLQSRVWSPMANYPLSPTNRARTWATGGTVLGQTVLGISNAIGFIGLGTECHSPNIPQQTLYAFDPPSIGQAMGSWIPFPSNNLLNFPVELNSGRTFVLGNNIYVGWRYDDSTTGNQMWRIAAEHGDTTAPALCKGDEIGAVEFDSLCCTGRVYIHKVNGSDIDKINYRVIGGSIDGASVLGWCSSFSAVPAFPASQGTIDFLPDCNAAGFWLNLEVSPSAGTTTIELEVVHVDGAVCEDTKTFHCQPPVATRCDSISVHPSAFAPYLNSNTGNILGSGLDFTIWNHIQPPALICAVKVDFITSTFVPANNIPNDIINNHIIVPIPPSQFALHSFMQNHSWTVNNSGTPSMSQMVFWDFATGSPGPQAGSLNIPTGAPFSFSPIYFSLFIEYQYDWSGQVKFTIIHCDGRECEQTIDWCARPNLHDCPQDIFPGDVSTLGDIGGITPDSGTRRFGDVITLSRRPDVGEVRSIGFRVRTEDSGLVSILSVGADQNEISVENIRVGSIAAYLDLAAPHSTESSEFNVSLLVESRRPQAKDVFLDIIYYNESSKPLATGRVRLETVVSGIGGGGDAEHYKPILYQTVPNPTAGDVLIRYRQTTNERVTLTVFDMVGNAVADIPVVSDTPGYHEIPFSVQNLATGTYSVRLSTTNGISIVQMIVAH